MNECGYLLCTWPEFLLAYGLWVAVVGLFGWLAWQAQRNLVKE